MIQYRIKGIQHIGIGSVNLDESYFWYKKYLGMQVKLFDSIASAPLMQSYTGGDIVNKRASFIFNLQGGGGLEIVQPYTFTSKKINNKTMLGDLGIFISKIKVRNVSDAFEFFQSQSVSILGEIRKGPDGLSVFYIKNTDGLIFQFVETKDVFVKTKHVTAGVGGCVIGVSSIEKSLAFWCCLGYSEIIYDETGLFPDFFPLPGGRLKFRRVLLKKKNRLFGGFGKFLGESYIELVQCIERNPDKISSGRMWGDAGFIHIGLDVHAMEEIKTKLAHHDIFFTADSGNALDMGGVSVHCVYIEDPDGALIELIEIYSISLCKRFGISLNIRKLFAKRPLPKIFFKALHFIFR